MLINYDIPDYYFYHPLSFQFGITVNKNLTFLFLMMTEIVLYNDVMPLLLEVRVLLYNQLEYSN